MHILNRTFVRATEKNIIFIAPTIVSYFPHSIVIIPKTYHNEKKRSGNCYFNATF